MNFYNHIHRSLKEFENSTLIVWPGRDGSFEKYSGGKLEEKINILCAYFHSKEINPVHKILLAIPVSIDAICAILAVQKIGAIPVIPPASSNLKMLFQILSKQKLKAIVVDNKMSFFLKMLLWFFKVKVIQLSYDLVAVTGREPADVPSTQAALISFTSGTTSQSKAIERSHSVLSAQHKVLKKAFPPQHEQRDFPLFPNILLHNLSCGVMSIMPDISGFALQNMEPAILVNQLEKFKISTFTANVFYLKKMIQFLSENDNQITSVTGIGIGGSPVPEWLPAKAKEYFPNATCYIIYGSSEAEPIAIRQTISTTENPADGYCVGTPIDDIAWKIDGETNIKSSGGTFQAGEVIVQGAHVAIEEGNWLRTGDFGFIDKNGQLYLTARKGNAQAYKSIQHYQIEHVLQHCARIDRAAAMYTDKGFRIFYNGSATSEEVQDIITKHFVENIIADIIFKKEIPVDSRHHSKILYAKLC